MAHRIFGGAVCDGDGIKAGLTAEADFILCF
jgi:hypothetical protein